MSGSNKILYYIMDYFLFRCQKHQTRIKMIEDVTKDYVKEEENTNKNNELDIVFDLEESRDFEKLAEIIKSESMYFRLEEDITYKIKLTTSKIREVEKTFENNGEIDKVIKYELGIIAKGSDKSEFVGLWEVGKSVLNPIMKNYEKDVLFNVSRTGSGKKTRYSVSKDF